MEIPSPRPPGAFESALARVERPVVFAILLATAIVQANAILHHSFMGQDWAIH